MCSFVFVLFFAYILGALLLVLKELQECLRAQMLVVQFSLLGNSWYFEIKMVLAGRVSQSKHSGCARGKQHYLFYLGIGNTRQWKLRWCAQFFMYHYFVVIDLHVPPCLKLRLYLVMISFSLFGHRGLGDHLECVYIYIYIFMEKNDY
ncbi:hypothetical protein ACOSQ3_004683 [Xanthoceras sorbifolium]